MASIVQATIGTGGTRDTPYRECVPFVPLSIPLMAGRDGTNVPPCPVCPAIGVRVRR